jgi:hypothetical protein
VANIILPGYPMPMGDKYMVIFDHIGPASYANVSTNAGAGDVLNALDIGMGGFDNVDVQGPSTDVSAAIVCYTPQGGSGNATPSVQLRWFTYPSAGTSGANGAEIANGTNLSGTGKAIRIVATCV